MRPKPAITFFPKQKKVTKKVLLKWLTHKCHRQITQPMPLQIFTHRPTQGDFALRKFVGCTRPGFLGLVEDYRGIIWDFMVT